MNIVTAYRHTATTGDPGPRTAARLLIIYLLLSAGLLFLAYRVEENTRHIGTDLHHDDLAAKYHACVAERVSATRFDALVRALAKGEADSLRTEPDPRLDPIRLRRIAVYRNAVAPIPSCVEAARDLAAH